MNAKDKSSLITQTFNDVAQAELNPQGEPRIGAFEITVVRDDGKSKVIWSGLDKKTKEEKFPNKEAA